MLFSVNSMFIHCRGLSYPAVMLEIQAQTRRGQTSPQQWSNTEDVMSAISEDWKLSESGSVC